MLKLNIYNAVDRIGIQLDYGQINIIPKTKENEILVKALQGKYDVEICNMK